MRGYGYTRATTGIQGCSKVALGGHLGVYAAGGTLEDSWSKIPRAPHRHLHPPDITQGTQESLDTIGKT